MVLCAVRRSCFFHSMIIFCALKLHIASASLLLFSAQRSCFAYTRRRLPIPNPGDGCVSPMRAGCHRTLSMMSWMDRMVRPGPGPRKGLHGTTDSNGIALIRRNTFFTGTTRDSPVSTGLDSSSEVTTVYTPLHVPESSHYRLPRVPASGYFRPTRCFPALKITITIYTQILLEGGYPNPHRSIRIGRYMATHTITSSL